MLDKVKLGLGIGSVGAIGVLGIVMIDHKTQKNLATFDKLENRYKELWEMEIRTVMEAKILAEFLISIRQDMVNSIGKSGGVMIDWNSDEMNNRLGGYLNTIEQSYIFVSKGTGDISAKDVMNIQVTPGFSGIMM